MIDHKILSYVQKSNEMSPLALDIYQKLYQQEGFYGYEVMESQEFGGRTVPAMLAIILNSEDPSYVDEAKMCINPNSGKPIKVVGNIIHETTHVGQLFDRENQKIPLADNIISFMGITFLCEAHAYSNEIEGPFRQIAALVRKGKTFDAAMKSVPIIDHYTTSDRYTTYLTWHINGLTNKNKSYLRYEEFYNDLRNWANQNSRKPISEREEQFVNARQNFMKNFFLMSDKDIKQQNDFYVRHSIEQFKENTERNERSEQRTKHRTEPSDVFKTILNFDKPILTDKQWYEVFGMSGMEQNKMDVLVHNIVSHTNSMVDFKEFLLSNNDSLILD